jgi:hypothetical protein
VVVVVGVGGDVGGVYAQDYHKQSKFACELNVELMSKGKEQLLTGPHAAQFTLQLKVESQSAVPPDTIVVAWKIRVCEV